MIESKLSLKVAGYKISAIKLEVLAHKASKNSGLGEVVSIADISKTYI